MWRRTTRKKWINIIRVLCRTIQEKENNNSDIIETERQQLSSEHVLYQIKNWKPVDTLWWQCMYGLKMVYLNLYTIITATTTTKNISSLVLFHFVLNIRQYNSYLQQIYIQYTHSSSEHTSGTNTISFNLFTYILYMYIQAKTDILIRAVLILLLLFVFLFIIFELRVFSFCWCICVFFFLFFLIFIIFSISFVLLAI